MFGTARGSMEAGKQFPDEQAADLSSAIALDADAAGTIYALLRQDEGELRIVLLDGRQEMLGAQQRQPAINFDVRGLQVAPSGRYLFLHGSDYQDASILVLAVVDLHGGTPLAGSTAARGAGGARHKQCRLLQVDPVLFSSRPGLVLFQASWHAHSEEHLVLLTSDNRLRLYHVTHSLAVAEQTLHVVPSAGALPQRYGLSPAPWGAAGGASASAAAASPSPLSYGLSAASPTAGGGAAAGAQVSPDMVAFAFGPATGWGQFAVLLLAADGHVYVLGPVAPFGMRVAAPTLEGLARQAGAEEWLAAAFGPDAPGNPLAKNRWPVLPHVVEGASPGLVGPLNPRARQELPVTARAASLAVSHALTLGAGAGASPSSVSTAVVSFADGRLLAYAVAGPWAPAWCDAQPQYMAPPGSAAASVGPSAVRYKCTLVNPSGEAEGGGGGGGGGVTPRMVLLDVVELPAAPVSRAGDASSRRSRGGGVGLVDDEEDDDDDGDGMYGTSIGASTPAVSAARRALTLHIQFGATGASTAGGGAAGAATVWACQRTGGCWRVMLPWSAMLPRWLGGPAAAGASREHLPSELPAPVVTCMYDVAAASQGSMTPASAATAAGGAAVVGSCIMSNPLLGGGLLLLSASGSLHFFQPAGAASLLMDMRLQQSSSAAAPSPQQQRPASGSSAAGGGPGPSPGGGVLPSPEQRKAQVEAHVKDVYGSLLTPPPDRALPKPPAGAPSPLTVAAPEGLRHLLDCVSQLRGCHVAFLHGASVELTERYEALRGEAVKHGAAAAELAELAGRLEDRQAALEGRVSRLRQLHDNLLERAAMLAKLHWSLPRALSRAELAARGELAGLDARFGSLRSQWGVLAERARRLCDERRSGGPGAARAATLRVASVPEAQLEKVHETVVAQYRGLTAARSALAALEQHLAAAAAERTAQQLEQGLGLSPGPASPAAALGALTLGLPLRSPAA
ncbi:hypothetical protein GPECTOR_61g795 [Gonium pectorale]|uniref:Uncharacterized protein n=1 Tax=Gonium pectorale TaxID=33097 RepID=A0A150G4Q8_GONPE|nr:hypothetical protein GPECTOR_61g795 [Gonium pectorale]|eukprot:KXZ44842.1 hypothetical protein GPECTOR_61g795 [Gonium pectorale]